MLSKQTNINNNNQSNNEISNLSNNNNNNNNINTEDFFLNGFNIQSSAFFNHHLSSKSSDFEHWNTKEDCDIFKIGNILNINNKNNLDNNEKENNQFRKDSFDFKVNRKNIYSKLIQVQQIPNENDYFKNRANSAINPNNNKFSNYILKSELNSNYQNYSKYNNNNKNNLLFNYYNNNQIENKKK